MTFKHGKNTGVAVGGVEISRFLNEANAGRSIDTAETSHFGSQAKTYVAGKDDGTFTVKGMFDGSTGGIDETSVALETQSLANDILPMTLADDGGYRPGARARVGLVKMTSWEVSSPVGDVVTVSGEFQADGGVHAGVILAGTTITASSDGGSVDNGAATTGDLLVYGHVFNGTDGDVTVTVQDSTDGSLWVDVAVLGPVAEDTSTGLFVRVTGGAERYLRAKTVLAGTSGSAQAIVSAVRS